jgi:hypothetical protein
MRLEIKKIRKIKNFKHIDSESDAEHMISPLKTAVL